MSEKQINLLEGNRYRKYEVDSDTFNLDLYDVVVPDSIIGYHHKNGKLVKAGLQGKIATIYFNPMNDSLIITVVSTEESKQNEEAQYA
jgi:hypothetical protein